VLNDRLANDVRRNGTHSNGTDDNRVLRALVQLQTLHIGNYNDSPSPTLMTV